MADVILEDCAGNQYTIPGIVHLPDVRGVLKWEVGISDCPVPGELVGPLLLRQVDAVVRSGYVLAILTFTQVGRGISG